MTRTSSTHAQDRPDDPPRRADLAEERAENERLRQIILALQRHRFGRRAESLPEDQLLLGLEEAEQVEAAGLVLADLVVVDLVAADLDDGAGLRCGGVGDEVRDGGEFTTGFTREADDTERVGVEADHAEVEGCEVGVVNDGPAEAGEFCCLLVDERFE